MVSCGLCLILEILGGIVILWVAVKFFQLLHQLIRPAKDLSKYGEWSIVTGPTGGIGEAIAKELAKQGQNLLLIGRSNEKLMRVQSAIAEKCTVQIETLEIDLSKFDNKNQVKFEKAIANKNIGILINNAGVSYQYVQYFDQVDQPTIENIMNVNVVAPTLLTKKNYYHIFLNKELVQLLIFQV